MDIETAVGCTNVGLLRISESVRAYLILSFEASARSSVIGNLASSLTAQSAFLNNFENVVNRKVDIQEDVKDTKRLSVTHQVRSITALGKTFSCYLVTWN